MFASVKNMRLSFVLGILASTLAAAALFFTPATFGLDHGHLVVKPLVAHAQWYNPLSYVEDLIKWALSWVLTTIIAIAAFILAIAGAIFDKLIDWTIINFGSVLKEQLNLTGGATSAIEVIWTAFRDITNIAIIGMFVFVAINTIIGNEEYGYKKYLHRIIIVAVLINFSLFFTKFSIDISHAVAGSFYTAMQGESLADAGTARGGKLDIANTIMGALGLNALGSLSEQQDALKKLNTGSDWGSTMLWYTMLISIVMLSFAAVLFYGCFVLLSRGILLILLMLTSAFAFATIMMPHLREHEYGWKGWSDALIRSTLFAPLFMVMLTAVIFVMNSISKDAKANLQGAGLANPTAAALNSLFIYALGVGLLYLSIRISASFSSNVAVMGWGNKIYGNMVMSGIRKSGLDRSLSSRANYIQSRRYAAKAEKAKIAGDAKSFEKFTLKSNQYKDKANKATESAALKMAANTFGLKGADVKGKAFGKVMDDKAKAAAEAVKAAQGTKEGKQGAQTKAVNEERENQAKQQSQERDQIKVQKEAAEREKQVHEEKLKQIEEENAAQEKAHNEKVRTQEIRASKAINPQEHANAQEEIARIKQERQRELDVQKGRIDTAKEKISSATATIRTLDTKTKGLDKQMEDAAKKAGEMAAKNYDATMETFQKEVADHAVTRIAGSNKESFEWKELHRLTMGHVRKSKQDNSILERIQKLGKEEKEEDETPRAPGAPSAQAPTH